MNRDLFWLTEEQFRRIKPHLPTDTRGKPRVDDRRVISGIVHILKSGGRWIDAPPDYEPRKTLYNRYVRWPPKVSGSISSTLLQARAAGIPDSVWSMDARAGGATEGEEAGADLEAIQGALTHNRKSTTLRYIRKRSTKIAQVAEARSHKRVAEAGGDGSGDCE